MLFKSFFYIDGNMQWHYAATLNRETLAPIREECRIYWRLINPAVSAWVSCDLLKGSIPFKVRMGLNSEYETWRLELKIRSRPKAKTLAQKLMEAW